MKMMLINILISVKQDAPQSNGLFNAADVFVVACICHVFLGFIEYAIVLLGFGKRLLVSDLVRTSSTDGRRWHLSPIETIQTNVQIELPENEKKMERLDPNQSKEQWNRLDLTSLFAYPLSFAIFCMIYFSQYLWY